MDQGDEVVAGTAGYNCAIGRFSAPLTGIDASEVITLYKGSGAEDFTLEQSQFTLEQCSVLFAKAARLLAVRWLVEAAEILESVPFRVVDATNHFEDEFRVLFAEVPLEEYERLRRIRNDFTERAVYAQIANVLAELGTYVRFIAAEVTFEPPPYPATTLGFSLKQFEIHMLVHKYIGVLGRELTEFSGRSHNEFYLELGLEIDPDNYTGTTRERLIKILSENSPKRQVCILEGILARFPVGSSNRRTEERAAEIRGWIERLRAGKKAERSDSSTSVVTDGRSTVDVREPTGSHDTNGVGEKVHTVPNEVYCYALTQSGKHPLNKDEYQKTVSKQTEYDMFIDGMTGDASYWRNETSRNVTRLTPRQRDLMIDFIEAKKPLRPRATRTGAKCSSAKSAQRLFQDALKKVDIRISRYQCRAFRLHQNSTDSSLNAYEFVPPEGFEYCLILPRE